MKRDGDGDGMRVTSPHCHAVSHCHMQSGEGNFLEGFLLQMA